MATYRIQLFPGLRVGSLTLIASELRPGPVPSDTGRRLYWHCLCDCGQETFYPARYLQRNREPSCGCMRATTIADSLQAGQRFGRLVIVSPSPKLYHWNCQCDCGGTKIVRTYHLTSGYIRSCGCLHKERFHGMIHKHGGYGTPEYVIWEGMKARCSNPNHIGWQNYGGRGITVCQEWIDSFPAFLADVGPRPSSKHSLDRTDNDKGYEPGNVQWVLPGEQQRNKRRKAHCKNGHEFTPENTRWRKGHNGGQSRDCRICLRNYMEQQKAKRL